MADKLQWVWGRHAVEETLKGRGRRIREVCVLHESRGEHIQEIVRLARESGATVRWVSGKDLHKIAGSNAHQGLAILAEAKKPESLAEFIERLTDADKKSMVLVALDQIQDPHNFGAIARSAVNLGARGLLLPERNSAPVTPAVIQSSAGAIEKIPVFNVGNLSQALIKLKEHGFWIYGADMAGKSSWDVTFNAPMVLVVGSEGHGIRPLVLEQCDEAIRIPQSKQGVESLNASCAASVLLYEVARQLKRF